MDIDKIIQELGLIDCSNLSKDQVNDLAKEIKNQMDEVDLKRAELRRIYLGVRKEYERLDAIDDMKRLEVLKVELTDRGFGIGTIHYIDRHDSLYVVEKIDNFHITFKRKKCSDIWGKNHCMGVDEIDKRLTPLKTKGTGAFSVGDVVTYMNEEYEVCGYMGYRMVLRKLRKEKYGDIIYKIISPKKENVYRSLII